MTSSLKLSPTAVTAKAPGLIWLSAQSLRTEPLKLVTSSELPQVSQWPFSSVFLHSHSVFEESQFQVVLQLCQSLSMSYWFIWLALGDVQWLGNFPVSTPCAFQSHFRWVAWSVPLSLCWRFCHYSTWPNIIDTQKIIIQLVSLLKPYILFWAKFWNVTGGKALV